MDMSLPFHAAQRTTRPRRSLSVTAIAALTAAAALMAPLAWRVANPAETASPAPSCADLLRGASEMKLIDLARGGGGLTCSLQPSSGR